MRAIDGGLARVAALERLPGALRVVVDVERQHAAEGHALALPHASGKVAADEAADVLHATLLVLAHRHVLAVGFAGARHLGAAGGKPLPRHGLVRPARRLARVGGGYSQFPIFHNSSLLCSVRSPRACSRRTRSRRTRGGRTTGSTLARRRRTMCSLVAFAS
ncbi:MAG: hypothetical protein J5529_03135 [Prevotella sp.]|nr:hypothetical protein [Prevotella sp.]